MTDRPEASPWLRLLGGCIVSFALAISPQVFAQDDSDDDEDDGSAPIEEIVTTGSRLKRDTYSSISPLQIITSQVSREVGLIDAADILQETTAAAGQQVDLTFQGFVLDNGPGASNVDLRGLGSARTLVLMNGRRLAPAGVEGAPFAANLNQIPASMVQQYDILLDGASSVYGSDAIAGVANVILRKDFDGLEIEGFTRVPEHSSGIDHTLSVVWGKNFDRGFIGFGGEYTESERVSLDQRPWTAGCDKHHEIDENGNFRSQERWFSDILGSAWDECRLGRTAGRFQVNTLRSGGSLYYTGPGTSNGGWGSYSSQRPRSDFNYTDSDGDGVADVRYRDFDRNGTPESQNADLFPETSAYSLMAYGEYTFDGEANITPYFEMMYQDFEFESRGRPPQLFPWVPPLNPFSPCNPAAVGGVDCGDAWDQFMANPAVIQQYMDAFDCDPSAGGSCDQTTGPIGAQYVRPIVGVRGDRQNTTTSGDQLRFVAGVRGDLPFMNVGSLDNWSFDVYASLTESDAVSERRGIREDRLDLAVGTYSLTNTPCEANDPNAAGLRSGLTIADLQDDVIPGCVPVNLFAPSLYETGYLGDFATAAERDYVFDGRNFDTNYKQDVFSGYVTGDIFELPAGGVALGFGLEYRIDDIGSIPDAVAREGLFFGFFSDGGATGQKDTEEAFAEIELPLLAGVPGAEELTINLSTRYTDDEYYGSDWTESYKLGWRPVDSLLIRGTWGTSFRAPNLRELFLQAQSGFGSVFDPCYNDDDSWDITNNVYVPSGDDREPEVLANCLANGVDPTLAYSNGFTSFSTEVASGGALDLNAETSESWSAGFAWDQPFTNAFGMSLGATYYEIEVNQTIIEPGRQFIVNDCYNSLTGNSVFCSRIQRNFSDPSNPRISLLDAGFINREAEKARGVDINLAFDDTWTVFERPVDVTWDVTANRQLERSTLFLDDDGNEDVDTFQGEWGFPDWSLRSGLRLDYDDWRLTWETRYLASVHQDPDGVDDFSDATIASDTCFGPPNDVLCRDYGDTDNYFLHHLSLYYYGDRWTFGGGIRNLLDEEPPVVDGTEVQAINNTPIGYGYDINGRTFFVNVGIDFGGDE
ncbi:MAG: TonB-dependent receptor domain-containing protein [Woeseiaceae bacterium]